MENRMMGNKSDDEDGGQEDPKEANEEEEGEDDNNKRDGKENTICAIGCRIHEDDFEVPSTWWAF
jgi:hypothetical protein